MDGNGSGGGGSSGDSWISEGRISEQGRGDEVLERWDADGSIPDRVISTVEAFVEEGLISGVKEAGSHFWDLAVFDYQVAQEEATARKVVQETAITDFSVVDDAVAGTSGLSASELRALGSQYEGDLDNVYANMGGVEVALQDRIHGFIDDGGTYSGFLAQGFQEVDFINDAARGMESAEENAAYQDWSEESPELRAFRLASEFRAINNAHDEPIMLDDYGGYTGEVDPELLAELQAEQRSKSAARSKPRPVLYNEFGEPIEPGDEYLAESATDSFRPPSMPELTFDELMQGGYTVEEANEYFGALEGIADATSDAVRSGNELTGTCYGEGEAAVSATGSTIGLDVALGRTASTAAQEFVPALDDSALRVALMTAGITDMSGEFLDLDEQSFLTAVGVLSSSEEMAEALGLSGAEMETVLAGLIGEYGSLEDAIYAAARAAAQGVAGPSGGGGGGQTGPTVKEVVDEAFSYHDESTRAWIAQNMGDVVQTGPNAGKTFQELADNEAYKAAHGGQNMPGFALGGIVPGPIGAPIMAMVHGGERILRSGQPGGGPTVIINVAGSVIAERDLVSRIRDGLRRETLLNSSVLDVSVVQA